MELREQIRQIMLDHPGRYLHILGVEKMAIKLAHLNNVDPMRASIAALLHDVAKKIPEKELREMMIQAGYDVSTHHKLWHAFIGSYLAKTEYDIEDEDILEAILYHTTGHPSMSMLAKIIFVADWIEENTRNYPGVEEIRKIALTNLDCAVALKLKHLIEKIPDGSIDTLRAWEYYKTYLKEGHTC